MKKYMGLILILICLINIFPMVSFAETESAASAELVTNTPSLVNMTEVVYGNEKTPKTDSAASRGVLQISLLQQAAQGLPRCDGS